jgi:hypothetical protein
MKNLILRTNIIDKNINIEQKVIPMPLTSDIVELIISPKKGYILDPEHLSHGLLPTQVSSIDFVKSGLNVIARVTMSSFLNSKVTQSVSLPLMSQSKLNIDSFSLIDKTKENDDKVSSIGTSIYPKFKVVDGESYNITCKPGETKLIMSKLITAVSGFYFSSGPSYKITNNKERYSVKENVFKDKSNRVVKKIFTIYYTSPKHLEEVRSEDYIEFTSTILKTSYDRKVYPATKKEEYEIYSFDEGRSIGAKGGTKVMRVRGVPGTEFKIIVQNNNLKTYNFTSGIFEDGGGMFFGIIPPARKDVGYGQKKVFVKIPKSSSGTTYTTTFTTDKPLDHELVQLAAKVGQVKTLGNAATIAAATAPIPGAVASFVKPPSATSAKSYSVMNFEFGNGGGFTIEELEWSPTPSEIVEDALIRSKIFTGKGRAGDSSADITFSVLIRPTDTESFLFAERSPLSSYPGTFVNWDSGSDKASALTSGGITIPNDWYMTDADVESGASFRVTTKWKYIGESKEAGGETVYSALQLKGNISEIIHGKTNTTAKLDLLNFLTIQAL